jgi:hypothetical protein
MFETFGLLRKRGQMGIINLTGDCEWKYLATQKTKPKFPSATRALSPN